jgi:hypothetical protein
MFSTLKGEQLPITSFLAESGRRKGQSKENTAPTRKRKRAEMEESSTLPSNKDQTHSNDTLDIDTKLATNKTVHRSDSTITNSAERARKIRLSSTSNRSAHAAMHGLNSDVVDLTDVAELPENTSFATPVSSVLATKARRHGRTKVLLEEQGQEQLMTPPSTDFPKRTAAQVDSYDSRSPLSSHTPSLGVSHFPRSKAVAGVPPNIIRTSPPCPTGGFGLPTPGFSVPRVKPKNLISVPSDHVRPLSNPDSNVPADNNYRLSSMPAQRSVELDPSADDDVFATREVDNSSTSVANIAEPGHRIPSHASTFNIPALPLWVRNPAEQHERSESLVLALTAECPPTPDDNAVVTSQSQDLRSYIISPLRVGRTSRIHSTPKSLRFSSKTQTGIFSSRPVDISVQNSPTYRGITQEIVASSQSPEIELKMSTKEASSLPYKIPSPTKSPARAEQFVLADNHLLRTPTKGKILSLTIRYFLLQGVTFRSMVLTDDIFDSDKMHADFSIPSRREIASLAAESSPAAEPDFSSPSQSRTDVKKTHLQLDETHDNFDKYNCTPPRGFSQSLKLFESQSLSPNAPRSFEAWRDRPKVALNSDSVTELDSEDEVAGGGMRPSHVEYGAHFQQHISNDKELSEDHDSATEQEPASPAVALDAIQSLDNPCLQRVATTGGQFDSKSDSLRLSAPVGNEKLDELSHAPHLPSSDATEYSDEDETYGRTPAPLREFLDMIKGDGSFPDDFPESWR